jgi:hypothetical protein
VQSSSRADGAPVSDRAWLLDAADLLAEPDPGPVPWLVEDLIVAQALVAVVGRWKTTKSYGLLDICISIATGRPAFGGLRVPEPGPVVFLNEESGRAALWRRLDSLCRGRAINPEEVRGRLYVAPNVGLRLDDPDCQRELLALGEDLRPRLFVFDPLARFKRALLDENTQTDMAVLIEFMRHLRKVTGAGVAFVHHVGHNGSHMRGSSDLESVWETRLEWERDGQSSEVTVKSEHREAEVGAPLAYRIGWDEETRTMRFDLVEDPLTTAVRAYLDEHPDASANSVDANVEGNRQAILKAAKKIRRGSTAPEPLGTTPGGPSSAAGSEAGDDPLRGSPPRTGAGGLVPADGNRLDEAQQQAWLATAPMDELREHYEGHA